MTRKRTPSEELEPRIKEAVNRLRVLPKFENLEKLPVKKVAEVARVSRSTIYKDPDLLDLCSLGVKEREEKGKTKCSKLTEEQKILRDLISSHARYDEVIERLEDCIEETTKKIFDNYVQLKSELSFEKDSQKDSAARYIAQLRESNNKLERDLAAELSRNKQANIDSKTNNVAPFYRKLHVSPDKYLVQGGKYIWDKERANRSWALARREFEKLISTERPDVVYLLTGPQNAGKTTWIREHQPTLPGKHLYFDATLPTEQERVDLAFTARSIFSEVKIVLVRVIANLETCLQRQRHRAMKQNVPEKVIRRTFEVYEEVSVVEPVDQIIIVRDELHVSDS